VTTPQERMRSIGWGAELLDRLQQDAAIPDELQQLAESAAVSYPCTTMLLELLASSSREFPRAAGRSIESARRVFEEVRNTGVGNEETRRHVLYTLRHFPLAGWSHDVDLSARLGHLDDWLAPDRT
jgi:hypothetical protein